MRKKQTRKRGFGTPRDQRNPLDYAVSSRDRSTMDMVAAAVRHKQVLLAFQPIVSAAHTDRPVFYEALLRVLDETGRVIPAKEFMAAVEESELGRLLDCHALELGIETLEKRPNLRLSVNMSARSIGYARWNDILDRALAGRSTLGERLILEISEKSVNQVPDIVKGFMDKMATRDLSFALDDYGAGMTRLDVFRAFPFDFIKLDGSFSRNIASDQANQVLSSAVAAIAQRFDMTSVASRVESPIDARTLAELGFDCLQGFAFGAPTVSPPWVQKPARGAKAG